MNIPTRQPYNCHCNALAQPTVPLIMHLTITCHWCADSDIYKGVAAQTNGDRNEGLNSRWVCAANPTKAMKDEWQKETKARYGLTQEQLAEAVAQLEELAASMQRTSGAKLGSPSKGRVPLCDLIGLLHAPYRHLPLPLLCRASRSCPHAVDGMLGLQRCIICWCTSAVRCVAAALSAHAQPFLSGG